MSPKNSQIAPERPIAELMDKYPIPGQKSSENARTERVACYIRVSTQEQKLHGLSLDAQKQKLIEYAEKHGLIIVAWYMDEGISGRKLIKNRPELQRMIHDAQARKFDRILFIKLDRFFRSVAEYHECMKLIDPVEWTATEEKYDLATPSGRAFVNMKITIAELEADQTGERIRLVNDYKVKAGLAVSGSVPFGFKIAKIEGKKRVVKDPETEHIVYDLLEHFQTFQSVRKTCFYINEKYNMSMLYKAYMSLLSNPLLCGFYRGNPEYCEAYIDAETFERIQGMIKRNKRDNNASRDYIFGGLLICPHCGLRLRGTTHNSLSRGRRYIYKAYRCQGNRLSHNCDFNKVVMESNVERQVLAGIESMLEGMKTSAAVTGEAESMDTGNRVKPEDIQAEIDRLNYSWRRGRIKDVEQYDREYDDLIAKLEAAKERENTEKKTDYSHIEGILQAGWKDIYNNLDDAHKFAFWRSFIESIEITWTTKEKRIDRINFF